MNEPATATDHAWRSRTLTGLVFVAAAGAYVAVRYGATTPIPMFIGACQRLRGSGLAITSKDWFCNPVPWTHHASYLGANLLVWLTFVVPCAILAATGRRFTALLPMVVAPFFTFAGFDILRVQWWGTSYWPAHSGMAIAVNLALLIAPVAAVSIANRWRRPHPGAGPWMVSVFVSGALLALATIAVVAIARSLFAQHFDLVGGSMTSQGLASIAVFGALLGPNRTWWPWSVAPVAVLLSLGPMGAVLTSPERFQLWSYFGDAIPLAVVGVLWAAWWPLSVAITQKARRTPGVDPERALAVPLEAEEEEIPPADVPRAQPRGVRPGVVLNSLAISLLAISLIMFRADPAPIQISAALPTFLGARANWQDVRTRLDLRQAMFTMDAYAAVHGDYRGFTAARGAAEDHSLVWAALSDLPRGKPTPSLTMIASTQSTQARIGAVSASGSAFCIGRAGPREPLTYGSASAAPGAAGWASSVRSTDARTLLGRALAICGRAPWTSRLVAAVPIDSLCDGREADDGYLMCRMVQAIGVKIMSTTKPI